MINEKLFDSSKLEKLFHNTAINYKYFYFTKLDFSSIHLDMYLECLKL